MFGLGLWEMVVIAIVALLVVGPDKLPDTAKKLSKGIRDFRKQTRDLQRTLDEDTELGDAVRDLKSALRGDDFRKPIPPPRTKPVPKPPEVAGAEPAGPALPAPAATPEATTTNEPAEAESASAEADPDLPVVKSADGTVAKNASTDELDANG